MDSLRGKVRDMASFRIRPVADKELFLENLGSAFESGCPEHIKEVIEDLTQVEANLNRSATTTASLVASVEALLPKLQRLLVNYPETPAWLLDELSSSLYEDVLAFVADHPATTVDKLVALANHDSPQVRSAVADNTRTPTEVLRMLSRDPHPDVRFRLAENYATPVNILSELALDENPYVSDRAQRTIERIRQSGTPVTGDVAQIDMSVPKAS